MSTAGAQVKRDWFDDPAQAGDGSAAREAGLRFSCTMCGNCCSGPEGYVLVSDEEATAIARRLGLPVEEFLREYTHVTAEGRSLKEKRTAHGLDCIFLDRQTVPGKAICGIYEDRPTQCSTWPFWPSVVKSRGSWDRASRNCPGMNKGRLYPPEQIRILRDSFSI